MYVSKCKNESENIHDRHEKFINDIKVFDTFKLNLIIKKKKSLVLIS